MSEKSALFMARTTRFHEFARSLTTTLGVEVSLAMAMPEPAQPGMFTSGTFQ